MYIYHSIFINEIPCIITDTKIVYIIYIQYIHILPSDIYLCNLHKKSSKNCATKQIQKSLVCLQFVNKLFISRS